MSFIFPILPLLLQELGVTDREELSFWTGWCFSITFLIAAIVSPVWGMMAQKKGYRLNLFRTGLGMIIFSVFVGFCTSPLHVFLLRLLMGVFSGFQSVALAYQSRVTPKSELGSVLGILMTASTAGGLVGPFFGGWFADLYGIATTFWIMGGISCLTLLPVLTTIPELPKDSEKPSAEKPSAWGLLTYSPLIVIFFATLVYRIVFMGASTSITLYIQETIGSIENIAFVSGVAFSISGFSAILGAPLLGKWSDRIGHQKALGISLVFSGLFMFANGFSNTLEWIYICRFFQGFFSSAIFPILVVLIKERAPDLLHGAASGLNQSFIYIGNVLGPLLASGLMTIMSIHSVFWFGGVFSILLGLSLALAFKPTQKVPESIESLPFKKSG